MDFILYCNAIKTLKFSETNPIFVWLEDNYP